jgi:hypothetical protein
MTGALGEEGAALRSSWMRAVAQPMLEAIATTSKALRDPMARSYP